jgi:hypothetical protein
MSECIPWALILCNARTCIGTMLSILYNILRAPARMYGKESKDIPDTLSEGASVTCREQCVRALSGGSDKLRSTFSHATLFPKLAADKICCGVSPDKLLHWMTERLGQRAMPKKEGSVIRMTLNQPIYCDSIKPGNKSTIERICRTNLSLQWRNSI